jgi:hypothetical protein
MTLAFVSPAWAHPWPWVEHHPGTGFMASFPPPLRARRKRAPRTWESVRPGCQSLELSLHFIWPDWIARGPGISILEFRAPEFQVELELTWPQSLVLLNSALGPGEEDEPLVVRWTPALLPWVMLLVAFESCVQFTKAKDSLSSCNVNWNRRNCSWAKGACHKLLPGNQKRHDHFL